jgi:hypothetical protein
MNEPASYLDDEQARGMAACYQCLQPTRWLAPDGRCAECTRCVPEDLQ